MLFGNSFVFLFSNLVNLTSKSSNTVISKLSCATLCVGREKCSSFFYNQNTKTCLCSPKRYLNTSQLKRVAGYEYYIMRPDCDADWIVINDQCYMVRTDKKQFHEARRQCGGLGGFLAKTDSYSDDFVIKSFESKYGIIWLGGLDEVEEGKWLWLDGALIKLPLWRPGDPSNFGGSENCLEQHATGWNDNNCRAQNIFLCEK